MAKAISIIQDKYMARESIGGRGSAAERPEPATREARQELIPRYSPETGDMIKRIGQQIEKSEKQAAGLGLLAKDVIFANDVEARRKIYAPKELAADRLIGEDAEYFEPTPGGTIKNLSTLVSGKYLSGALGLVDTRKLKPENRGRKFDLSAQERIMVAKGVGVEPEKIGPEYGKRYEGGPKQGRVVFLRDKSEQETIEAAVGVLEKRLQELETKGNSLIQEKRGLEELRLQREQIKNLKKLSPQNIEKLNREEEKIGVSIVKQRDDLAIQLTNIRPWVERHQGVVEQALVEDRALLAAATEHEKNISGQIKDLEDQVRIIGGAGKIAAILGADQLEEWKREKAQLEINLQGFITHRELINKTITDLERKKTEADSMVERINKIGRTEAEIRAEKDEQIRLERERQAAPVAAVAPAVNSPEISGEDDRSIFHGENDAEGESQIGDSVVEIEATTNEMPEPAPESEAERAAVDQSAADWEEEQEVTFLQKVGRFFTRPLGAKAKSEQQNLDALADEANATAAAEREKQQTDNLENISTEASEAAAPNQDEWAEREAGQQAAAEREKQQIDILENQINPAPETAEQLESDDWVEAEVKAQDEAERERQQVDDSGGQVNQAEETAEPDRGDDSTSDEAVAEQEKQAWAEREVEAAKAGAGEIRRGSFRPKGGRREPRRPRVEEQPTPPRPEPIEPAPAVETATPEPGAGGAEERISKAAVDWWLDRLFPSVMKQKDRAAMVKNFSLLGQGFNSEAEMTWAQAARSYGNYLVDTKKVGTNRALEVTVRKFHKIGFKDISADSLIAELKAEALANTPRRKVETPRESGPTDVQATGAPAVEVPVAGLKEPKAPAADAEPAPKPEPELVAPPAGAVTAEPGRAEAAPSPEATVETEPKEAAAVADNAPAQVETEGLEAEAAPMATVGEILDLLGLSGATGKAEEIIEANFKTPGQEEFDRDTKLTKTQAKKAATAYFKEFAGLPTRQAKKADKGKLDKLFKPEQ